MRRPAFNLCALIFCAVASLAATRAHAQSIDGFQIGADVKGAMLTHTAPAAAGKLGDFDAYRWQLDNGNVTSVTAAQDSGTIVFIESDWGGEGAKPATDLPGVNFGATSLADIRKKFGSNGFSFKAHSVKALGDELVSVNCFELAVDKNKVLAFASAMPIAQLESADKPPPTDKLKVQAVILADMTYLQSIWGADRVADPKYRPVQWK